MATCLPIDPLHPEEKILRRAAEILRGGGLVAFPTETVYGLGANALDARSVAGIFAAKGRPTNNPLIVHVPDQDAAYPLVQEWPPIAERLARRFWPGPLTLVLPKSEQVPLAVTAGGPTVALRVPAHAVAVGLLRRCGFPLAAPSANSATRISATRAEHVLADLGHKVDLILDGGPTPGGLESTVLDVTSTPPRLLRPGLVRPADLLALVGPVLCPGRDEPRDGQVAPSPGMLGRHYAPRTPLECIDGNGAARVESYCRLGLRIGWLTFEGQERTVSAGVVVRALPSDPQGYCAAFYAALHDLDAAGVDRIMVDLPPRTEPWLAIHDRLARAALASFGVR